MNGNDDPEKLHQNNRMLITLADSQNPNSYCKDYIRGFCTRENCRFMHERPSKSCLKEMFKFCHDFQNKVCYRPNCKFIHSTREDEEHFYATGVFPRDSRDPRSLPVCQVFLQGTCQNQDCKFLHPSDQPALNGSEVMALVRNLPPPAFNGPPPNFRSDDSPPEPKFRRYNYEENIETQLLQQTNMCPNCENLEHKVKLLHDNISVLLKKIADVSEKNAQLTSMNEFLLEQTASVRSGQPCVITSRHCTSAPVSLATVSVTPIVSLAGTIPALMPATAAPNLTLAPAASRAQLLTPAPQLLSVSTTQQLVGNSGALIVTSAGAQQLMQVTDSGTLMGGGQTVVAVTPAQLTLAPQAQQLISSAPQNVQQLVQQSALQTQLGQQHQSAQFAATQQSVQHLTQQSAQHLAQQSSQHLAQQSAQHLAHQSVQHLAQQSAQHLAQQSALAQQNQQLAQHTALAQQNQQLAQNQQQLVHQTSTQITISSNSQPMALPNSQAQTITFPIISQSILPH